MSGVPPEVEALLDIDKPSRLQVLLVMSVVFPESLSRPSTLGTVLTGGCSGIKALEMNLEAMPTWHLPTFWRTEILQAMAYSKLFFF